METYKEHLEEDLADIDTDNLATDNLVDNIPRYEKPNPYNYTKVELAKKETEIKNAQKDFPHVSPMYIEILYDMIKKGKTKEEIDENINKGLWEGKASKRNTGGTIKAIEILDAI